MRLRINNRESKRRTAFITGASRGIGQLIAQALAAERTNLGVRGQAIRKLKGSPVPARALVAPDGGEILMRRGSRIKVDAFMKFDQYVTSGAWPPATFEEFLAQRGLREERVE